MIQIPVDKKAITSKLYFVNKFTWLDVHDQERFQGHPKEGRVYRGEYNSNTKNYGLLVDDNNMLIMDTLVVQGDRERYNFNSEIVELTKDNILSFNILEEDLDNIIKWTEKPAKAPQPHQLPMLVLSQAMKQQEQEESEAAHLAVNTLMELYDVNETQFYILIELAQFLTEKAAEDIDDPTYELSVGPYGLSQNLAKALTHLKTYSSTDRRKNQNIEDLKQALSGIITEWTRKLYLKEID